MKLRNPVFYKGQLYGWCYENSFSLLMADEHRGSQIVHGLVCKKGATDWIEHAWLESGDGETVYDSSLGRIERHRMADIPDLCELKPLPRFSQIEAVKEFVRHGHYGPWYQSREKALQELFDLIAASIEGGAQPQKGAAWQL